jgi:hypothetical protein
MLEILGRINCLGLDFGGEGYGLDLMAFLVLVLRSGWCIGYGIQQDCRL